MLKHVGQVINTGRRCVVVFREIYDDNGNVIDKNNCLVVETDSLPDGIHADIMRIVESEPAQHTGDFFNVLHRTRLGDGSPALAYLIRSGRLRKFPTSQVLLTPDSNNELRLDKMNKILSMQKEGKSQSEIASALNETANEPPIPASAIPAADNIANSYSTDASDIPAVLMPDINKAVTDGILTDTQIAKVKFDNAKIMQEQATALLAESYALDPSLKPRRGRPPKSKSE